MRWRAAFVLLVAALACGQEPARPPQPPPSDTPERPPDWPPRHAADTFGPNREWMVRTQLVQRGIGDEAVLRAMRTVPRHSFVPVALRAHAYEDRPLPIGHDQTISQPYIVASMTEELRLKEGMKVLEIGTGSAYQAAVLAQITPFVFTIEIREPLVVTAKGTLKRLGYKTVQVRHGDGYYGWKEEAPFDAIMVTAAAPHVPPPLVEQLKPGGRLILPVGPPFGTQDLRLVTKDEKGAVRSRSLYDVRFVPLTGTLGKEKEKGAGGGGGTQGERERRRRREARLKTTVFALSAAVLVHEICLLRILSIAYWHHAASLVVSVALLGFGVAGTLLALMPRLKRAGTTPFCAALYALLVPASLHAARSVDFNILEVGWDRTQWLRLLALEAIFLVPFLVAALGILSALARAAERPGPVYAANLLGSGLGAIVAPLLLRLEPPVDVLRFVAVFAALAAVPAWPRRMLPWWLVAALSTGLGKWDDLPMSPFKDFEAAPDKREIVTRFGPLGRVDRAVVTSLHYAPGLSLTAPLFPEGQTALFVDGHLAGAVGGGEHLPYTVGDLPYRLLGRVPERVLLLGLGPDLPRATLVVDPDRNLLDLAGANGRSEEPRAFVDVAMGLNTQWLPYDIVVHHVPTLHAAAETPLLTVEGLRAGLAYAGEGGFAVSCALTTPPRAGLKLLATADLVTLHLVAARTADRLCVVLRHRAPTDEEKERVLAFCRGNGFDPVRPADWAFDEPFHETPTPLDAPGPDYPYDIRPATDARPYFFKFFRWSRILDLFAKGATTFVEWAYVAMVVAFLQVALLGALLMAVPVAWTRAARAPAALFLALGLGYMLLEMAYLARAMVRLEGPAEAAAAVFGGFLVGSGLGSLCSARLRHAALFVAILALPGYYLMPSSTLPAAALCALVAFPMGAPFPAALSRLGAASVPWALAWNGCAGVAAAAAAPLISSSLSIPFTAGAAALSYLAIWRGSGGR